MCGILTPPIPIAACEPIHKTPYVTYTVVAINVFVYSLLMVIGLVDLLEGGSSSVRYLIVNVLGYVPSKHYIWTFLSSSFTHERLFHLLGNLLFLWILGVFVEERLGTRKYIFLILISAICGSLGHHLAILFLGSRGMMDIPCYGASDVVAGISGAQLILLPMLQYRFIMFYGFLYYLRKHTWEMPVAIYTSVWLVFQIINLFYSEQKSGIAFGAHLGGALAGIIIGSVIRWTPKSQKTIDYEKKILQKDQESELRLVYETFRKALDERVTEAALWLYRRDQRGDLPLPLTVQDHIRMGDLLEKDNEPFGAEKIYRSLLESQPLTETERIEIGIRLARILLWHEKDLEASKKLLRYLHRRYIQHPRYPEIQSLIEETRNAEKNLFKRQR